MSIELELDQPVRPEADGPAHEMATPDEAGLHLDRATPFDVVVLGAGISGLVGASVLLEQGASRVLVIDEYGHVGGNHIDRSIGEYSFDVGSFIFQDDSPLVRRFPELLPHYIVIKPTFARLNPQGVVTRYPFSVPQDLLAAGPVEIARILLSALAGRLFTGEQKNARSFAEYWIGARLLWRAGLENYMERFYGVPPEQIEITFAEKRMGWIKENASIATHVRRLLGKFRKKKITGPRNKQLARPKPGFAQLYQPLVDTLSRSGVDFQLGANLLRITREPGGFEVATGRGVVRASRVVSTIPIPRLQVLCGMKPHDLQTVTLISLFFSFSGERGFPESILFNFSHEGGWKRLTVYSDFYGLANNRQYFTAEVNADQVGGTVEGAERDFRKHVRANGLFKGDLVLEGSHALDTAYPVYTKQASERAKEAVRELTEFGITSFGRQGAFDYQPTARVSTLVAEAELAPQTTLTV